jgi:hypothetical protein
VRPLPPSRPTTWLHPRDALVATLRRICRHKRTTTAGGHLSIRDPDGGSWITLSRVDPGSLQPTDMPDLQGFFVVVKRVAALGKAAAALTQHRPLALALLEIGGTAAAEADANAEGLQSCERREPGGGRLDRLQPVEFGLERCDAGGVDRGLVHPAGEKIADPFFDRGGATGFAAARSAIVRRFF